MTLNLFIQTLFFSFSIMITSKVVHLVSVVPIEMDALTSVLCSWSIEALK